MRTLVIGGTGLIGSHLVANLEDRRLPYLATCYHRPRPFFSPLDVRDADSVHELIAEYQPDVTFLAAGIASHEFAATQSKQARELVVGGATTAAEAVQAHGGKLVVFSGDGVFGESKRAMREACALQPIGALAECQAEMEQVVRATLPNQHLIVRTSRVFGASVNRLATLLRETDAFPADNERFCQPTYAPDLADVAIEAAKNGTLGTLHIAGPDRSTDFSFARLVAHLYGIDADVVLAESEEAGLRPIAAWLDRFELRRGFGPNAIRNIADALRHVRAKGLMNSQKPVLQAA